MIRLFGVVVASEKEIVNLVNEVAIKSKLNRRCISLHELVPARYGSMFPELSEEERREAEIEAKKLLVEVARDYAEEQLES
jgi:hypothetical protein